jgi:hypothetical protein
MSVPLGSKAFRLAISLHAQPTRRLKNPVLAVKAHSIARAKPAPGVVVGPLGEQMILVKRQSNMWKMRSPKSKRPKTINPELQAAIGFCVSDIAIQYWDIGLNEEALSRLKNYRINESISPKITFLPNGMNALIRILESNDGNELGSPTYSTIIAAMS